MCFLVAYCKIWFVVGSSRVHILLYFIIYFSSTHLILYFNKCHCQGKLGGKPYLIQLGKWHKNSTFVEPTTNTQITTHVQAQ